MFTEGGSLAGRSRDASTFAKDYPVSRLPHGHPLFISILMSILFSFTQRFHAHRHRAAAERAILF